MTLSVHLLSDIIPVVFLISGFLHAPNARRFFAANGKSDKSTTLIAFVTDAGIDADFIGGAAITLDFVGETIVADGFTGAATVDTDFVASVVLADDFTGEDAADIEFVVVVLTDDFTGEAAVEVVDDDLPFPFSILS